MTLKLLLDEDCQDKILVKKLSEAGHDVLTVKDLGLLSQPDNVVLECAVRNKRIVLTRNCEDFLNEALMLKNSGRHHHGVLLRYEKNDPAKDMSYNDIVRAIGNIDKAIAGGTLILIDQEVSLSYYRYRSSRTRSKESSIRRKRSKKQR